MNPPNPRCLLLGLATAAGLLLSPSARAATVFVDFGPNDGTNGNATTSPDVNGHYWNNMISAFTVATGLTGSNFVTSTNTATTVGITVGSGWSTNGILNGGLTVPSAALLGDFAISTVTQDYFFVQGANGVNGTITLTGLDPTMTYDLSMFGTRAATDPVRTSSYSVTDVNGAHSSTLVTTGTAIGAGGYNGNNNKLATLTGLVPNASNQIVLNVSIVNGGFAYLGGLQITSVPEAGTSALVAFSGLLLLTARRRRA